MKDFYEDQGESSIQGSKDAIRLAFKRGLIKDGDRWMDMVENTKLTFHTYNEEVASNMVKLITHQYFQAFTALQTALADKVDSK